MATEKLRILLIAGCTRSGSTILDNILGQSPGFFSGGELVDFWHFAQVEERLCACGARIRECEIWKGVFRGLEGQSLPNTINGSTRDHYQHLRLRDLWRLTTKSGRARFLELASQCAREALELYRLISEESHAHTIVDSSKSVERAYLLTQIPELDVYVVHLVRDPRAVVFSWRRKKPDPSLPNSYMHTYRPVNSTVRWILSQQVERLCNIPGRYLMIRYEDLMAAPDRELQRIFTMLGEPIERRPRIINQMICLDCVHSINGNPSRFKKGPVILQTDDEWCRGMSRSDRAVVNILTWPLLRRYGYKLGTQPIAPSIADAAK